MWLVLNKHGGAGIGLAAHEDEAGGNNVLILDKSGNRVVGLGTFSKTGNGVAIFDTQGNKAIGLQSNDRANSVSVSDRQGKEAVLLSSDEVSNRVSCHG